MRGSAAVVVAGLLLAAASVQAANEVTVRDTGHYVMDEAGVIGPEQRQQMENWLRELREKTGAQVKVLTVKSTGDEDFFDFSQRHYELWRLGQAGKDDGALIVFDLGGRHVRIHTGNGLEGALPDSWCGTLSRRIAGEYFKRHQYGEGLFQMTIAVANQVADDAGVKLTGLPEFRHLRPPEQSPYAVLIAIAIILLILWINWRTRKWGRRRRFWGPVYGGGWGGGYGGSFGGGWGGSSGGGGGGLDFGGGGHSSGGGGGASW